MLACGMLEWSVVSVPIAVIRVNHQHMLIQWITSSRVRKIRDDRVRGSPYSLNTMRNTREKIIEMRTQRLQSPRIEGEAPGAAGVAGGGGCGRRGRRTETTLLGCDIREVLVRKV